MPVLVEYTQTFLDKSWEWLKDPEIRELTMTPDFSREEQLNFFNGLPDRSDYWIRGLAEDDMPIGAMGLKHITTQEAEYWGYIGERAYWSRGIGNFMMQAAVDKAKELGLGRLYLFVDEHNQRAIQLYTRHGFQCVGTGEKEKYLLYL